MNNKCVIGPDLVAVARKVLEARAENQAKARRSEAMAKISNKPLKEVYGEDYGTIDKYCYACAIDNNEPGTDKIFSKCHLPLYTPDGAILKSGVHFAAEALGGARGGVKASPDMKFEAAKKVISLYKELGEEPPEGISKIAGRKENSAAKLSYEFLEAVYMLAKEDPDIWAKIKDKIHAPARGSAGGQIAAKNRSSNEVPRLLFAASLASPSINYQDDDIIEVGIVPFKEGVITGTDGIPTRRLYKNFAPYARRFNGKEITDGHLGRDLLPSDPILGDLNTARANPDKLHVRVLAQFNRKALSLDTLERIKNGTLEVSPEYRADLDWVPGEMNGQHYERTETGNYRIYNLAVVPVGACRPPDCGVLMNSASKAELDNVEGADYVGSAKQYKCKRAQNMKHELPKIEKNMMLPAIQRLMNGQGPLTKEDILSMIDDVLEEGNDFEQKSLAFTTLMQIGMAIAQMTNFPTTTILMNSAPVPSADAKALEDKIKILEDKLATTDGTVRQLNSSHTQEKQAEEAARENAKKAAFFRQCNAAYQAPSEQDKIWPDIRATGESLYLEQHPEIRLKNAANLHVNGRRMTNGSVSPAETKRQEMVDARNKKLGYT